MHRVIISMTSISCRLHKLKKTLTSLINQTHKPDAIHVCYSNEKFMYDEGIDDEMINKIYNEIKLIDFNDNNIILTKTKNIGPYRKLIPVLKKYKDDIIITVDDDIYYEKNFVYKLLNGYNAHKCIICSKYRTINLDNEKITNTNYFIEENTPFMNILPEGFGGILYHTNMFSADFIEFDYGGLEDIIMKNDDLFFRLYTYYKNIPVVSVDISIDEMKEDNDIALYYNYNINKSFEERIQKIKNINIINKYISDKIRTSYEETAEKIESIVKNYIGHGTDIKILQYEIFAKNINENPINLISLIGEYFFNKEVTANVIVINIEKDTERLKSYVSEIKKINIKTFVHLKATYWRNKLQFEYDMNYVLHFLKQFKKIKTTEITMNDFSMWNDDNIKIQDGPLACYCSHTRALIYAYQNYNDYVIICEDDMYISNTENIEKYIKCIPSNWDVITLGSMPINKSYETPYYKYISNFHSTHCYIVKVTCLPIIFENIYPINEQIDILISRLYNRLNIYNICDTVFQKNFSTNTQNNIHTILNGEGYAGIRIAIEKFEKLLYENMTHRLEKANDDDKRRLVENILIDVVYAYITSNKTEIIDSTMYPLANTNQQMFDLLYYIIICCVKGINTTITVNMLLNDIDNIIENYDSCVDPYGYGSTSNVSRDDNIIIKKYNKKLRWNHDKHNNINAIFNKEKYILSQLHNTTNFPKIYKITNDSIHMQFMGKSLYDDFNLPNNWQEQIEHLFDILSENNIIYYEFNLKNIVNLNNNISFIDFGLAEISEHAINKNMENCETFIKLIEQIKRQYEGIESTKERKLLYFTFMNNMRNGNKYMDNIY